MKAALMKKRLALLLVLLLLAVSLLTACGQIEDANGPEDQSLVTLTDADILNPLNSYATVGTVKTELWNKCTYRAKKFSGVFTVTELSCEEELTLSSSILCEAGNLRAVLVKDDEIVLELPLREEGSFTLSPGRYKVRIAGESARFSLTLKYE
jgi:hypothetical protein